MPINLNPQLTEYPKWKISLAKEKTPAETPGESDPTNVCFCHIVGVIDPPSHDAIGKSKPQNRFS